MGFAHLFSTNPVVLGHWSRRVVACFVVEWKSGWIYDACISRPTFASQRVLEDLLMVLSYCQTKCFCTI
ncbi:hypothetical protein MKW98_013864 [Papaver atlanticum]|uniref:Uncharacterized protein n=1 Tax=Papaver atlanticum TaxID=357466 RepID=A0AAD4XU19_9MAGN|nr:hypothetical protein MKW98_013864 [Papaver atlanticum]